MKRKRLTKNVKDVQNTTLIELVAEEKQITGRKTVTEYMVDQLNELGAAKTFRQWRRRWYDMSYIANSRHAEFLKLTSQASNEDINDPRTVNDMAILRVLDVIGSDQEACPTQATPTFEEEVEETTKETLAMCIEDQNKALIRLVHEEKRITGRKTVTEAMLEELHELDPTKTLQQWRRRWYDMSYKANTRHSEFLKLVNHASDGDEVIDPRTVNDIAVLRVTDVIESELDECPNEDIGKTAKKPNAKPTFVKTPRCSAKKVTVNQKKELIRLISAYSQAGRLPYVTSTMCARLNRIGPPKTFNQWRKCWSSLCHQTKLKNPKHLTSMRPHKKCKYDAPREQSTLKVLNIIKNVENVTEFDDVEVPPPDDGINFLSMCRICMATERLQPIDEPILKSLLVLEIKICHNWPKEICYTCLVDLNRAIKLIDRSKTTEQLLLKSSKASKNVFILEEIKMEPDDTPPDSEPAVTTFLAIEQQLAPVAKVPQQRPTTAKYVCQVCKKVCHSQSYLAVHHFRCHDNVKCLMCDQVVSTINSLRYHLAKFHQNSWNHLCPQCGKQFATKGEMNIHIANRHIETKAVVKCGKCPKTFTSNGARNLHFKRTHNPSTSKYICGYANCMAKYFGKNELRIHMLEKHLGVYRYECEYCDKKFYQQNEKNRHQLVHTGEKPFQCTFLGCKKAYTQKYDMLMHRMTHVDGALPYVCDTCGLGFRMKGELDNHKMQHSF